MEINLDGKFKLRFDPNEIRVNIDGEKIDIGARIKEERVLPEINEPGFYGPGLLEKEDREYDVKFRSIEGNEECDVVDFLDDNTLYFDNDTGISALGAYFKNKYLKGKKLKKSEDSPTQK